MSTKVTAEMVKELRERTGVGMGKCKEALDQAGGNMELAIDNLRKAGMASAVKKEGRETNEGLIAAAEGPKAFAILEINAETDFVTQNERFKQFLQEMAQEIAETLPASIEAFSAQVYRKDPSLTIDQHRSIVMQSLGENIRLKRFHIFHKSPETSIGVYSHMGGKVVTAVEISGSADVSQLAKEIAMHVAAESPEYLRPENVPAEVVAREAEIAKAQVQGKPANIVDKIVAGKIQAFYDQVCLTHQKYIKDNSISITELVDRKAKHLERALVLRAFLRWKAGE